MLHKKMILLSVRITTQTGENSCIRSPVVLQGALWVIPACDHISEGRVELWIKFELLSDMELWKYFPFTYEEVIVNNRNKSGTFRGLRRTRRTCIFHCGNHASNLFTKSSWISLTSSSVYMKPLFNPEIFVLFFFTSVLHLLHVRNVINAPTCLLWIFWIFPCSILTF